MYERTDQYLDGRPAPDHADAEGRNFVEEKHKRGDVLFWENDKATHLIHILDGFVKMVKHGSGGKDTIVGLYGPGDVLGEVNLLDGRRYNATAIVMTPTEIARQSAESFHRKLVDDPAYLRRLALKLSERLRDAEDAMQGMATERVEKRIASLLVKFADRQKCDEVCTLEIPLTRQEVADMVGATIETTIRIFSRLIQDGSIQRGGRRLRIADLDRLREIAEA